VSAWSGVKIAAMGVLGVIALAVLSWRMTRVHWYGTIEAGDYRVRVVDRYGRGVPGAKVRVTLAGRPPGSRLFANYSGPDSIRTNDDGEFALTVPRPVRTGGEQRRLFWIWRVGDVGFCGKLRVEVRARGYVSAVVPAREVMDRETIAIVVLRPSVE